MKPLKERLPLIDAAIGELSGEFPPTAIGYSGRGYYAKGDMGDILHKINFGDVCSRDEFNQRKAELQNKPSWNEAPEWANWLAQDNDGQWVWYKTKPLVEGNEFDGGERLLGLDFGKVIGNWQDTLEQRPTTTEKDEPVKYEYGVEYPTNGKKPDLPDGVLVELLYRDGDKDETTRLGILRWNHNGNDGDILSFRIVDERYKPKEQDDG